MSKQSPPDRNCTAQLSRDLSQIPTRCFGGQAASARRKTARLVSVSFAVSGESAAYVHVDFDYAFDHAVNKEAAAIPIETYLCPSTPRSTPLNRGRGATDYGGIYGERIVSTNSPPRGVMIHDRAIRIRDITDGTTRTLAISEDADFPDGQWINGRNLFDQAFSINRAPKFENDIRSMHPQGAIGLFADGSVSFLNENIELELLASLCTRNGNERFPDFDR